jgi:hypothetical protein
MITPTPARKDRGVAVITIALDNINTEDLKKFHCSICGHVVFGYYDTAHILIPKDSTGELSVLKNALQEIVCTNRWTDDKGHTNRCKTIYVLNRG